MVALQGEYPFIGIENTVMLTSEVGTQVSFEDFIMSFKAALKSAFYERNDISAFIQKRGFPALVLRDIMATKPLSVVIPTQYGGRGGHVRECLGLLEAASYESIPLTLTFGINIALFLEPVAKYAQESVKEGIFNRFLTKGHMGGLMITEPDYGSDALNMQTSNAKHGDHYHIKGVKHWQGLTGMADYWLMTSRNQRDDGSLGRDIDLFICDEHQTDQRIIVEEYYNALGLFPIPYGKNIVDIKVPEAYKLVPETTGIKVMLDLLHRSRYQFAGMGMGFLKRMLDESIAECKRRFVGGKALFELDQVKFQISQIQAAFTACSAMCHRSAAFSGLENNLSGNIVEANSIKAYLTDLMQFAAQTATQLGGANGYKIENPCARGIIDSRPFQIFEGSNEMLYTQIGEAVLKLMRRSKVSNFIEFLSDYDLTKNTIGHFKNILNFTIDGPLAQRKVVEIGKVISRLISANQVVALGSKGFNADLIQNCILMIQHEVSYIISSYTNHNEVTPIAEYEDNAHWLSFS